MLQAAILGGLFSGIVGALPFIGAGNCCCCLWNICGGAIAAYLEQQNTGKTTNVGRGALAGLASGVVAAVVWLFLTLAMAAVFGSAGLALQQAAVDQDVPPEVRDALEMIGNSGPALLYGSFFFLMLFIGSAMSAVGGALSGAFFRNDVPPALGGPPPIPE